MQNADTYDDLVESMLQGFNKTMKDLETEYNSLVNDKQQEM
jgi:hypothetical protein